jgi:dipeptidyl aminopeptidase/acylaminoacyl peptidase
MDTPFDLETFLAQPRLGGLALSPDGDRLVVGVSTVAPDGKRFRTALWALDPTGGTAPRQLTRSAPGESAATFARDGALLFASARPDPDAADSAGDPPAALWSLPADGGEARLVVAPGSGVQGLDVARDSGRIVLHASLHPQAATLAEDREREQARKDAGVTAQLFETYPIRYWDSYLGPREPARFVLSPEDADPVGPLDAPTSTGAAATTTTSPAAATSTTSPAAEDDTADSPTGLEPPLLVRGAGLHTTSGDLTPDGTTYITAWHPHGEHRRRTSPDDLVSQLVAIDVETGARRVLSPDDGRSYGSPAVSPDDRTVVAVAQDLGAPDRAEEDSLVLIDLASGELTELAADWDRWPSSPRWLPDGAAVLVEADDLGHRPVFRVDVTSGDVTRLTASGHHTEVCVAPDGVHAYALRSTLAGPPRPVRFRVDTAEQDPEVLPSPAGPDPEVADLERVVAAAEDGVEIGGWLVRPRDTEGPVPLVVFIHGGPLGSWNMWSWRWNPNVFAAQGYAVLLPDPALSTGYGRDFVARGWGRWGDEPFTDLLAIVEATAARDDIDGERVAATGGSFGGYMANWVAGHSDRFRCIITHASLWALENFHGTTDLGLFWEREFGDPYVDPSRFQEHSPNRHVGSISTPMLVIHGERDLRVPISEGLILWTDLVRHGVDARFLYFPDENHWILKPHNSRLWYQTFAAFLDEHLRDQDFARPELL